MIHLATLRGRLYWRLLQHVCSLISQSARSPGLVVLIQIKNILFYLCYSFIKFVDVIVSATRSIFLSLPPSDPYYYEGVPPVPDLLPPPYGGEDRGIPLSLSPSM